MDELEQKVMRNLIRSADEDTQRIALSVSTALKSDDGALDRPWNIRDVESFLDLSAQMAKFERELKRG